MRRLRWSRSGVMSLVARGPWIERGHSVPSGSPTVIPLAACLGTRRRYEVWAVLAVVWETCVELEVIGVPGRGFGFPHRSSPAAWRWRAFAGDEERELERHTRGWSLGTEMQLDTVAFERPPDDVRGINVVAVDPKGRCWRLPLSLNGPACVRAARTTGCGVCGAALEDLKDPGLCRGCDEQRERMLRALQGALPTSLVRVDAWDATLRVKGEGRMRIHAVSGWTDRTLVHFRTRGRLPHGISLRLHAGGASRAGWDPVAFRSAKNWRHLTVSVPGRLPAVDAIDLLDPSGATVAQAVQRGESL